MYLETLNHIFNDLTTLNNVLVSIISMSCDPHPCIHNFSNPMEYRVYIRCIAMFIKLNLHPLYSIDEF